MRLDTDDPRQVEDFLTLGERVAAHDRDGMPECRHQTRHLITRAVPGEHREMYRVVEDGETVGALMITIPERENSHLAQFGLLVAPGHRRRGIGTALLETALTRAREHGCTTMLTNATGPLPERSVWADTASEFAAVHGFTAAQRMIGQQLDLADSEAAAGRWWPEAARASAGYDLVGYVDEVPEELAEGVATLVTRVNLDVPTGEVDRKVVEFDVARLRESEVAERERGVRRVGVAARHRETGEVAGYSTLLITRGNPWLASVNMTLVAPPHRGHRLGLAMKIRVQRDVVRHFPAVTTIDTGNADVNDHMREVNRRLGFRPIGAVTVYQRRL
ncbi:acetyltransferase (GNAT) family protein [Stackebrandtia albiflava]|uniref:Acetyltransferase (GNAT) family protein n=2 Tax=Stackebrandtia albiflava TaxID=406432 RepID=A0A562UYM2_9ACTN|nr:acetyltransferase (GNAT) family protein [Stackebrandtia albiflava]